MTGQEPPEQPSVINAVLPTGAIGAYRWDTCPAVAATLWLSDGTTHQVRGILTEWSSNRQFAFRGGGYSVWLHEDHLRPLS